MNSDVVTAADYPQLAFNPSDYFSPAGFEQMADLGHVQALIKSLTSGYGTDAATFTGGRALTVESLDKVLQDVLWTEEHVKLFKALRKSPVFATVDQWVERSDYGSEFGVAVAETANPEIVTATMTRRYAEVKYYRDRRSVSHVLTLLNNIEEAEAEEETAGTRRILGRIEADLFTGNDTVFSTRIRGLQSIIATQGGDLVQDAHGDAVDTQDLFHLLAGVIYKEAGKLTEVYYNPMCQADIDSALQVAQRIMVPTTTADGKIVVGATQTSLATAYGVIDFHPDIFVRAGWEMQAPNVAVGPSAPSAPTVNSVTGNAGTIYNQTNLPAGTYYVRVSAVSETGESAASTATAVALQAGKTIQISVSPGAVVPTGYRVYLSAVDASSGDDCRFHEEVAYTGSPQTITIDGHWVTGSTTIFCLSTAPAQGAIDFRQLLPLMKMPLAVTEPVIPFLLNLYGYLRVRKPNWHAMIKNVVPNVVQDQGWKPLG